MGMDVFGKKPKNKSGEYFRNNIWYWHPLWDFCSFVAPNITEKAPDAHSNSGDGLNGIDSIKLALQLKESLKNGIADSYIEKFNKAKETAALVSCYCKDSIFKTIGLNDISLCNTCNGTGLMIDPITSFAIDKENILNFISFLEDCGGFEIC